MLRIKPVSDRIARIIAWFSFVGIMIITVLTILDVLLSKLLNSPIPGTFEIVERLMIVTVFSAFAYGQTQKTHINMTLVLDKFPKKVQMFLFSLVGLISVCASGLLAYAAFVQTDNSIKLNYQTAVLKIPFWPFYLVEGIAMVIFTLTLLYDMILSISAIFNSKYYEIVTESWD